MTAWTPEAQPASTAAGAVTLVEGSSFCVCNAGGDVTNAATYGVFSQDTRILSRWELTVDGEHPEPLAAMTPDPYRATFLGRLSRPSGQTRTNLLVERERRVGDGLREDIVITNHGAEPAACRVDLAVDADFADLFEVKAGVVEPRGDRTAQGHDERLVLEHRWREGHWAMVVDAPGSLVAPPHEGQGPGRISYDIEVPPRGQWSTSILVSTVVDGVEVESPFPLGRPLEDSLPAARLRRWEATTPVATAADRGVQMVLRRSQQDLGALRIFDRDDPSLAAVAAGAPWYMALFGRDSLLTAYMALPVDHTLALGTLQTLARHQGRTVDPMTEEEPGKILHEMRQGAEGLALGGGSTYYGTADASPLFVVLLGELARWGVGPERLRGLLPSADRALDWVDKYGDRDGDGFVEYERSSERGLRNQGWKDSPDGVTFADGRPAEPSIALCEVQGYVYDAFRARALVAQEVGEESVARQWLERAATLKAAFNDRFWLPERGWYALALDRDKAPVDSCASNMGHCLWSGIVDEDKARAVVDRLMSPEMFTGWGIRTLATDMGAYDPVSYHNGSVWPHDNALIVAGMVRYGFVEEAQQVATALLEAAEAFGGRLPELFCGFDRSAYPEPVPYPTSCSPQAWAAATPVQLLRSLLQLEPWLCRDRVWLDPVLPPALLPLRLQGLNLGEHRVDLEVTPDGTTLQGLPSDVEVRTAAYRSDPEGSVGPIP